MPLLFASQGQTVQVLKVSGNAAVIQHLREIGFSTGNKVTVVQKMPNGIIVRVKDSRIALDKLMASKIRIQMDA